MQRKKQAKELERQAKKEAKEREKQERQQAKELMKTQKEREKLLKKVCLLVHWQEECVSLFAQCVLENKRYKTKKNLTGSYTELIALFSGLVCKMINPNHLLIWYSSIQRGVFAFWMCELKSDWVCNIFVLLSSRQTVWIRKWTIAWTTASRYEY